MNTVISTMTKENRRSFKKLITPETYMIADKFTDNKMTSLRFYDKKMNEVERIYLESWPDDEKLKEFSSSHDLDIRENVVFCPDHPRGERIITVYGEVNQKRKEAKECQEAFEEKQRKAIAQAYLMLRKYNSLMTEEKNLGFLIEHYKKLKEDKIVDLMLMNQIKRVMLEIISTKKLGEIESLFEFAIRDCIGAYAMPGNATMDEIIRRLPDSFLGEKVPFLKAHCKKLNECPTPGYFSPEAVYITKVLSDISERVAVAEN